MYFKSERACGKLLSPNQFHKRSKSFPLIGQKNIFFSGQSVWRSCKTTLSPSYTKRFFSSIEATCRGTLWGGGGLNVATTSKNFCRYRNIAHKNGQISQRVNRLSWNWMSYRNHYSALLCYSTLLHFSTLVYVKFKANNTEIIPYFEIHITKVPQENLSNTAKPPNVPLFKKNIFKEAEEIASWNAWALGINTRRSIFHGGLIQGIP